MALYSMIQFISILILYTEGALLSDMMFLYIDLCITTTAAVLMGITGPYKKLVSRRPIGSLVSFVTISSVVLQILISLIVQLGTLYFLRQQKWFVKGKIVGNDRIIAWETTFIFCISSYQYLILATVFCKGPPFRNTFFSNIYFMSAVVVLIGISTVLLFEPIPVINSFFKMKGNITMHVHFKICILIIAFINFVISALIESIVSSMAFKQFSNILTCKKQPKNLYKRLIEQIDYDVFWPSVECRKFSSAVS
ncbi:ATP13A2 (predicted) [Pycnogonum litorale]